IYNDGTIIFLSGKELTEKVFTDKQIVDIDFLKIDGTGFFVGRRALNDIKGTRVATVLCFKKAPAFFDYLGKTLPFVFIYSFIFVFFIGFFVFRHYGRAKIFLNDLENTLMNFSKGEYGVIKNFKKPKEFSHIYDMLDEIALRISNYIRDLNNEISKRATEVFEINKAMVLLNKCKDIESLISKSERLLKEDLGLNSIGIEECNDLIKRCSHCELKKITARFADKEYGFCVEISDKEDDITNDFLDIFQELFTTNILRIGSSLKINETNLEYVELSEILMVLMTKRNITEIFNLILEKAKEICRADASYIGVYDKGTDSIMLKFFININSDEFKSLKFNKNQGLGGLVIRERRGIFVQNYFTDLRIDSPFKEIVKKEGIISTIAVPIFYEDDIFGILYVGYRSLKKDITFELSFLQKMATAAAIAIERENYTSELKNKELELRKAYDELLERRKEINELLKGYKDANLELERSNRELMEQYEIVKKSYEELNNLNKAKDLFLGILSHELKTPITIVKGYIETLLSKDFNLSEDAKSALSTTLKAVNSLSDKVDDLLDYMRLETKKLKLYLQEVSFRDLFEEIIRELTPFIEERKQKIIVKNDDIRFKGDKKWLKKAFSAIVNNSIKFSPDEKNIYISFEVIDREKLFLPYYVKEKPIFANKYLAISVKDEGVGIPETEINRIFDSFYELGDIRTHSTGKYKFMSKGVGLGLSFTKQIISMHNGIVYAESSGFDIENCPGTTIKIILPIEEETIVSDKMKDSIVIIDSDYEFSRFLELFLSQKYSVHLFDDGGVGYLKVLEIKPKLVMINVSLKNYDGYEVCSVIKEEKSIKDIPVILYGTGPESFDEIRAQRVKANMIFYPVFDTENLLRIVEYYMKK
ncbi:MAG: ATP-binding protein, partial [Proteobacteria bacterium]|nr:ATP-binding protein [Pseudomonadota bacterium]